MTDIVYGLDSSALLAIDLLRRDPNGLACQLAARAMRLTEHASWPLVPPVRDFVAPDVIEARNNALAMGQDSTLERLNPTYAAQASGDTLASLVIGTAADARDAILSFAPSDSSLRPAINMLADGVIGLWSRQRITHENLLLLLAPARTYMRHAPLHLDSVDFDPHTAEVRALVRRIGRLRPVDFLALEHAPIDSSRWEEDMQEATAASAFSDRQRTAAMAQFTAMAMLGSVARRHSITLSCLVLVATSLAGAVQATMVTDVMPSEAAERLLRDWQVATPERLETNLRHPGA